MVYYGKLWKTMETYGLLENIQKKTDCNLQSAN